MNIKAINDENCGNGEDEHNGEDFYINLHQKIDDKIKTIRSELRKHRGKPISNSKQVRQRKPFEMSADKSINVNLFRDMSVKSEMMATFCDQGLKYSGLVSEKKLHPWRKWYRTKEYELFPGESVKSKELIKPIYWFIFILFSFFWFLHQNTQTRKQCLLFLHSQKVYVYKKC